MFDTIIFSAREQIMNLNSYSIMALPRLDNSEQLASDMISSSLVVVSPSVTVFCVSQLLGCDLIAIFKRLK